MVTASHNPECDNGVKLVDPMGEMLEGSWESMATTLANTRAASLHAAIASIVESVGASTRISSRCQFSQCRFAGIDLTAASHVIFARDTRPSGPHLVCTM